MVNQNMIGIFRRIKELFHFRVMYGCVHTGIGYQLGDGADIEERVLEFGTIPHIWFRILLSVKVTTKQNVYTFYGMGKEYKWERIERV